MSMNILTEIDGQYTLPDLLWQEMESPSALRQFLTYGFVDNLIKITWRVERIAPADKNRWTSLGRMARGSLELSTGCVRLLQ